MTVCSTVTIPPKQPKIMAQKYQIYRILIIWENGIRKSIDKRYYTDDLETPRRLYKKKYNAKRIYLSYHEKED